MMGSEFEMAGLDASERSGEQFCSIRVSGRRRFNILPASAIPILLGLGSSANAQAIPWINGEFASPWNAQKIFEPSSLPDLTDPDTREEIPPEDMPVKKRQQPGYEPVGIRSGSWMFNPSLISGSFYDSNVFSSNTAQRSDIAAVIEPTLRAHTLWERHGVDLKLDAQSTVYNQYLEPEPDQCQPEGQWLARYRERSRCC